MSETVSVIVSPTIRPVKLAGWMIPRSTIRIDVVSPGGLEPAIGIGPDGTDHIAEGAADVDVDVGTADDQAGVVAAPCSGDFSDGRRDDGGAGEERNDRQEYGDAHHT